MKNKLLLGGASVAVCYCRLVVLAMLIAVVRTTSGQSSTETTGDGSAGQRLYFEHGCYGCHGYGGETGERVLIGSGFLSSETAFISYLRLRAEQNPILPSTQMPNYPAESLSDEQARALYAYIRTFKSSASASEDIPTLDAIIDAASRRYDRR